MDPFVTTIFSKNEEDTASAASNLAPLISAPCLIMFKAGIGMGKTVFTRALIRTLMADPSLEVTSPTYPLLQIYEMKKYSIYHYDLYRLDEVSNEILQDLSWDDACANAITLVEWAEKLPVSRKQADILIEIRPDPDHTNARVITITHNKSRTEK
jgi:tRNA threonylcarbamoyl adenosine modification protein YjeE